MQEMIEGAPAAVRRRSAEQAHALVVELVSAHADSLLRVARRHSLCPDDAHDAYQRGLEILLRHADRLDPERAAGWIHTVVKHEAMAVRASRQRILGGGEIDLDALESRTTPSPEEQAIAFERVGRAAEALQRLKPQEVQAMWLKAAGNSYTEICEATGWTYTKVNRSLAEGRKSFLERFAGIESGAECERWAASLSAIVDGEATAEQVVAVRPHLRNCAGCRATIRELREARPVLAAVFPAGSLVLADDRVPGQLARLAEVAFSGIHDRIAGLVVRAQAIADATSVGKATAVVASAAAIAGGGMAVRDVDRPAVPPAAPSEHAEAERPPTAPTAPVPEAAPATPAPQSPDPAPAAHPDTSAAPAAASPASDPRPARHEPAPAAAPDPPADELGLETTTTAAATAAPPAPTPAPRPAPSTPPAAAKPAPAAKPAASEFALEGP